VVSQIALSLVLAAGASLFVRTLRQLLAVDPGYEPEQVISATIHTRASGYTYAELPGLYQRLLAETEAVPGVRSASLSVHGFAAGARRTSGFTVPGRTRELAWDNSGQELFVTPAFFTTLGIPLLRGRGFAETDRTPGNLVAIVSESMARHFFDTVDVVGRRIGYGTPAEFEIIGVVRDAHANTLKGTPPRIIYYPLAQGPMEYATSLEARIAGPPGPMIGAIRTAISRVDQSLPIGRVSALDDLLGRGLQSERLVASLAGIFSLVALLLAGVGLYGVVAYSVTRRTNEMGVRLALGARPGTVRWIVLRDCWILVTAGIIAGAILWLPVFRVVRNLIYGIPPQDLLSPLLGAVVLALVGTAAAALPAWRASRIDPATALRAD
jgi:predicted permease